MPVFFQGPVGRTTACPDEATQGTTQFVRIKSPADANIVFDTHRSIIVRMQIAEQGNYQFLHTIGNDVYIYVFGDRIGSLTLSGISFATDCEDVTFPAINVATADSPDPTVDDKQHGFEKMLQWYMIDHASRLMQYSIQMVTLPEKK